MKIVKLNIVNYLKLKDIEINPNHTNVIVGKNKQGKTSILKAIRTAFTGDADSSSIRVGENKAEITIEMEDLIVKRTITAKDNYLDIENKEGFKMPAPQKFLNGILGVFSFNPIEFFDKKPADRKKYLLNAIDMKITEDEMFAYTGQKFTGIDYTKHALEVVEDTRKYFYDQRTIVNSEVTKKEKTIEELSSQLPEGFDIKSVDEEKIKMLREGIQKDKAEKAKAEQNGKDIDRLRESETEIKAEIEKLQLKLTGVQEQIVEKLNTKFDFSDDVSLKAFEDTLAKMEGQREFVFTAKKIEDTRSELNEAIIKAEKLDEIVKKLSKEVPEDLIKKAKLPVEGLTVSDKDILINGISLDNLSTSEQLKFGLEIVRALNGDFKIICVDGLEGLDKESFEFFLNEIKEDDFQYFVTRVDGNGDISVEDGEIKSNK